VEVVAGDGRLSAVRFIRNSLGEPDASGRRSPVPIPGSEFALPLETLVVAISEEPQKETLAGLALTRGGTLSVNAESAVTSRPGVFAGGDVASGPGTVIAAIAAGKRAALMIDRYLKGKMLKVLAKVQLPNVFIEPVGEPGGEEVETVGRVAVPQLCVAERCGNFNEVELAIGEHAAMTEARRCMRCDLEFTHPV
jgi:NADPH-dependent glutamate synthase beta subunit-like oxidoreductase